MEKTARSVGSLQVGMPSLTDGLFSCDFYYSANTLTVGEDEIKSVSLQVSKEFDKLLKINGMWKPGVDFGKLETAMRQVAPGQIHIICSVRLPPKNPIIINTKH